MAFRIVVGYDGSEGAQAALDAAVDLAKVRAGTVLVTYAYGGPKQYSGAPLTPRRTLKELGKTLLDEAVTRCTDRDVDLETVLVDESAAQGLLSVARQHRAEMIAVGTHGQSPVSGLLLGSTAYKLVHISTKPVLIVPAAKRQRRAA